MTLEDYFEFETEPVEHIRIKGTRINIEQVLRLHELGVPPERIVERFSSLELKLVYATILYTLEHPTEVEAYLARCDGTSRLVRQRYEDSLTLEQRAKQRAFDSRLASQQRQWTKPDGSLDREKLEEQADSHRHEVVRS
ncbi:MAG: DUF433 domain-containing protein [Gemmataceae bacterium]